MTATRKKQHTPLLYPPGRLARGDVEFADSGAWHLCHRPGRSSHGWVSLHLFRTERAPKVSYWLGWSVIERRLARSRDAGRLREAQPDVLAWVERECRVKLDVQHAQPAHTLV